MAITNERQKKSVCISIRRYIIYRPVDFVIEARSFKNPKCGEAANLLPSLTLGFFSKYSPGKGEFNL